MSGGHWNYQNDRLCDEIFSFLSPKYGEHQKESCLARRLNPLEDKIISEIVFDVLCILHSYDYYTSADIREEVYRKDVEVFKRKWIKYPSKEKIKQTVDEELEHTRKELYKMYQLE